MNKKYDVFVIGSGMAGMTVANRCAAKDLKVGITDELPYGGTCALRGCDPKKVIIGVTEAQDFCRRLAGKGIESVPRLNWEGIMKFKETFVKDIPEKIEKGYKNKEIHTYHSPAKFIDRNLLQVGEEVIEADKFVIATGAKPMTLEFEGGSYAMTSTDFLNLKELPESILFIGGGYIAFEFAQIAARAGSSVTILQRGKRPLKGFDPDLVALLVEETTNLGVKIVLQTEATRIQARNSSFIVQGNCKGKVSEFRAGAVFNTAGRPPSIADLDLDKAGVDYTKKGVSVNDFLQSSSNSNVYAAGDAADSNGLPLTPVAVMEGHVVSTNILKGNSKKIDYPPIPTVVFTVPPMASVGISEEEARTNGMDIRINHDQVANWFNARRLNTKTYAYKTIIDNNSNTILGAHLLGPHSDETINLFAMAIQTKMNTSDLRTMVFAYPTMASDLTYML